MELSHTQVEPISPYTYNFFEYIDPKISGIIRALLSKGYLTGFSCDGHRNSLPRFLVIAFGNELQRKELLNCLKTFRAYRYLQLERQDTTCVEKFDGETIVWQNRESEVKGFNRLFLRSYEDYVFLRITIGWNSPVPPTEIKFWGELKHNVLSAVAFSLNWVFRESATLRFQNEIEIKLPNFIG